MEKNDNLPVSSKNNFMAKLRKAMFVFLSSVGLASNITTLTYAQTEKQAIEINYKKPKDNFKDSLKVDFNSQNKKIIQEILNDREEKGLGQYSQDTGAHEEVKSLLLYMLNMIDKNFEMNASKRGKLAITKEEYKNEIISLIKNIDDIISVDKGGLENQYTEYFKERPLARAFYTIGDIKNDLGVIKKNRIVFRKTKDLEILVYRIIHEITHSKQGKSGENSLYAQNANVKSMLNEGHSNNKAEYVRALKTIVDDNVNKNLPSNRSQTDYDLPTILYNKLGYFLGEQKMDECMQAQEVDLYDKIVDDLDSRYGNGITLKLYKNLTNLSLYFFSYEGLLTNERIEKIYAEIAEKDEKITDMLQQGILDNNSADVVRKINNSLKNTLDDICQTKEGKKQNISVSQHEELKKLEKLSLKCINQDIKGISNRNEALDYIQKWDYYRNRCCISNTYVLDEESVLLSENFELVSKVQHNLYKKCIEYGALNIKSEDIFDRMLESQLYNVQDAKMTIIIDENKEKKLIISDKYLCNEFEVIDKKNGKRRFSSGDDYYYKRKECRKKDFGKYS